MKIAVIGAGIAGMGCAWALSRTHEVVLFEKNPSVGGHARTIQVESDHKPVSVDTGFIVFNRPNYPNLCALFDHLDVPVAKSRMSFGVSLPKEGFEYGTGGLKGFLGQKRNLFRLSFWRMFLDILRFNRRARSECETGMTLGELLDSMRMSEAFRNRYLLPMAASIWSTPTDKMLNYPAESFLRFFENHGLLTLFNQPQWYTVEGGSREYVQRLMDEFAGETITGAAIKEVHRGRTENTVVIEFEDGSEAHFDKVVFACHADQALSLLSDADASELATLTNFEFQENDVVTHSDSTLMPARKACWSSWIYLASGIDSGVSLSYWMNNLQPLPTEEPVLVTMNPGQEPASDRVFDQWVTEHPLFNQDAIEAQTKLDDIQGKHNTYFCGAWTGYGFHEDGLRSGLSIAERLGAELPWSAQTC